MANIQKAIEILKQAKEYVGDQLDGDFKDRSDNVFDRLIGSLSHASGQSTDALPSGAGKPLTHILGKPLHRNKRVKDIKKSMAPTTEQISDMQLFIGQAIADFPHLTNAELREKYGDLVIRAVAAKTGLTVSINEPEKINSAFINEIRVKMGIDAEKEQAQQLADDAAKGAEETVIASPPEETSAAAPSEPENTGSEEVTKNAPAAQPAKPSPAANNNKTKVK